MLSARDFEDQLTFERLSAARLFLLKLIDQSDQETARGYAWQRFSSARDRLGTSSPLTTASMLEKFMSHLGGVVTMANMREQFMNLLSGVVIEDSLQILAAASLRKETNNDETQWAINVWIELYIIHNLFSAKSNFYNDRLLSSKVINPDALMILINLGIKVSDALLYELILQNKDGKNDEVLKKLFANHATRIDIEKLIEYAAALSLKSGRELFLLKTVVNLTELGVFDAKAIRKAIIALPQKMQESQLDPEGMNKEREKEQVEKEKTKSEKIPKVKSARKPDSRLRDNIAELLWGEITEQSISAHVEETQQIMNNCSEKGMLQALETIDQKSISYIKLPYLLAAINISLILLRLVPDSKKKKSIVDNLLFKLVLSPHNDNGAIQAAIYMLLTEFKANACQNFMKFNFRDGDTTETLLQRHMLEQFQVQIAMQLVRAGANPNELTCGDECVSLLSKLTSLNEPTADDSHKGKYDAEIRELVVDHHANLNLLQPIDKVRTRDCSVLQELLLKTDKKIPALMQLIRLGAEFDIAQVLMYLISVECSDENNWAIKELFEIYNSNVLKQDIFDIKGFAEYLKGILRDKGISREKFIIHTVINLINLGARPDMFVQKDIFDALEILAVSSEVKAKEYVKAARDKNAALGKVLRPPAVDLTKRFKIEDSLQANRVFFTKIYKLLDAYDQGPNERLRQLIVESERNNLTDWKEVLRLVKEEGANPNIKSAEKIAVGLADLMSITLPVLSIMEELLELGLDVGGVGTGIYLKVTSEKKYDFFCKIVEFGCDFNIHKDHSVLDQVTHILLHDASPDLLACIPTLLNFGVPISNTEGGAERIGVIAKWLFETATMEQLTPNTLINLKQYKKEILKQILTWHPDLTFSALEQISERPDSVLGKAFREGHVDRARTKSAFGSACAEYQKRKDEKEALAKRQFEKANPDKIVTAKISADADFGAITHWLFRIAKIEEITPEIRANLKPHKKAMREAILAMNLDDSTEALRQISQEEKSVLGCVFREGHTDRSRGEFGKACDEYTRRTSAPAPSFASSFLSFARGMISRPAPVSANLDHEEDREDKDSDSALGHFNNL